MFLAIDFKNIELPASSKVVQVAWTTFQVRSLKQRALKIFKVRGSLLVLEDADVALFQHNGTCQVGAIYIYIYIQNFF